MLLYCIFLTDNNIIFPLMKDLGDPVSLKLGKKEKKKIGGKIKKKISLNYRLASNSACFEDSVFFFSAVILSLSDTLCFLLG